MVTKPSSAPVDWWEKVAGLDFSSAWVGLLGPY